MNEASSEDRAWTSAQGQVNSFMFAAAEPTVGTKLTDHERHRLTHQFKGMYMRINTMSDRIAELEAAVRVLGELSHRQANRERLEEMARGASSIEVAEDQMNNAISLLTAMRAVMSNPIASAAMKGTQ